MLTRTRQTRTRTNNTGIITQNLNFLWPSMSYSQSSSYRLTTLCWPCVLDLWPFTCKILLHLPSSFAGNVLLLTVGTSVCSSEPEDRFKLFVKSANVNTHNHCCNYYCNTTAFMHANLHSESKKWDTILLSTVSPNTDWFSKFFHHQAQQEIYNKEIIKDTITPQMRCYTTLWNMNVDNYKQSEAMQLVNDKF